MQLQALLTDIKINTIKGDNNPMINDIQFDSRKVEDGSVFVAVRGVQVDGHRFIEKAIEKGAKVIVCEDLPEVLKTEITYVKVESSAETLGKLASNFYGNPSHQLKLVGVTGTNGKTTTATLLYKLFMDLGYKTGLLSTVENKIINDTIKATHTTPDAVQLNALLAQMLAAGVDYVFMEVSSHAIHQRRIAGLKFEGGIFTNITHDHLDYHKTFKEYINAKKQFFDDLPKSAFALTNLDDRRGKVMLQNTAARQKTYAIRKLADFKAKILDNSLTGLHLKINGREFYSQLIGEFNVSNLLAVYGTTTLLGVDEVEALTSMSRLKTAEGRFDYIIENEKVAIVDYAHTPDALEKVLATIDQLKGSSQVITVVGCGGDRDRAKRPIMAKVACDYSQLIILTNDNPRTEDPNEILKEMERGVPRYATNRTLTISDRRQAIKTACALAKSGDIILVAGKGHEKYQEINGVKHPFDDKEVLREFLKG